MALLEDNPELDLYDKDWVIHTRSEERAPAKVGPTAQVHRSLISHGCVIDGTVVNCVLSPGVRVDVGAVVRDSIVMFDSVIRSRRRRRPRDPRQGGRRRAGRDRRRGSRTTTARTGRSRAASTPASPSSASRRSCPRGARIGRNVKIGADVRTTDFVKRVIKSGDSVERPSAAGQPTARPPRRRPPRADPPASRLDSAGHAIRRPRRARRAPGRRRALVRRARAGAPRASRP